MWGSISGRTFQSAKATKYEVGILFNFGPRPQYKRMVFDNSRKGSLSWVTLTDADHADQR